MVVLFLFHFRCPFQNETLHGRIGWRWIIDAKVTKDNLGGLYVSLIFLYTRNFFYPPFSNYIQTYRQLWPFYFFSLFLFYKYFSETPDLDNLLIAPSINETDISEENWSGETITSYVYNGFILQYFWMKCKWNWKNYNFSFVNIIIWLLSFSLID